MDVQQAVKAAFDQFRSLYVGQDIRLLQLEEVDKEGPNWLITVSYSRPGDSSLPGVFVPEFVREYKIIKLNPIGELVSMKIRQP